MTYLFFLIWFFRLLAPGLGLATSNRQCSFLNPSFTGLVYSGMPDASFVPGPGAPVFHDMDGKNKNFAALLNHPEAIGAVKSHDKAVDTIVEFAGLPKDAWGCQLEAHFSAGIHHVHFLGSKPSTLEVCSTRNVPRYSSKDKYPVLTWRNAPTCSALHGRISGEDIRKMASGGHATVDKVVDGQMHTIVNSMRCKERMTFRISVADEVEEGGTGLVQKKGAIGGWMMKYNC